MKFLVLFVFVAAVMVIDARPSESNVPSPKKNEEIKEALKIGNEIEKNEEIKEALKISNEIERSKKHIHRTQYSGWQSSSVNVAESSASVHPNYGHPNYHHSHLPIHHLPNYSTSHSDSHGFAANVNLPHSSLSIAESEAHHQQETFG